MIERQNNCSQMTPIQAWKTKLELFFDPQNLKLVCKRNLVILLQTRNRYERRKRDSSLQTGFTWKMADSIEADAATRNGESSPNVPEIELIIKASTIDGRRKGACLFCHEYFMDLYLLAELKTISLKITTVDMLKPPPDFRSNFEATPPPILLDEGVAILENEDIERHIMKNIPGGHNLFVRDKEVASKIENVYSKFKIMLLKKDAHSKEILLANLQKINDHMEAKGSR